MNSLLSTSKSTIMRKIPISKYFNPVWSNLLFDKMLKSDIFKLVHNLFLSLVWLFFCCGYSFLITQCTLNIGLHVSSHSLADDSTINHLFKYSTPRNSDLKSQYIMTTMKPSNATITKQPSVGHWFNKGLQYPHCGAETYQFTDCDKFTTSQPAIDKNYFHEPNYTELAKRLICTLQKINCPQEATSFQIHDIPCQSSCLAYLAVCRQWPTNDQSNLNPSTNNPPSGCPVTTIHNRNYRSHDTIRRNSKYEMNPYAPLPNPYDRYPEYERGSQSRRIVRIPNYTPYIPHTVPNTNSYPLRKSNRNLLNDLDKSRSSYRPWHLNRERRITKLGAPQSRSMQRMSNNYRNELNMIPYHSNSQLQFSPNSQRSTMQMLPLTVSDCMFLPPGGCDKWSDFLTNLNRFDQPDFKNSLKLNPECPAETSEKCSAMFPRTFSRTQWVKGNFTVAAIIRITGTLWWFGKDGRFQPMVRFSVQKTLDSDIHPYDDKMILTYSWPMQCVCPDEITVGKRYLMLTHSYKLRQTLHITKNTVFLSRVKRFTKKLACWKGACAHGHGGIREQRYHPSIWKRDEGK